MDPKYSLLRSKELTILPHPEPQQQDPTPSKPTLRSTLILSAHLSLCIPINLFRSGLPTKFLYALLLLPIRATLPTHLIILHSMTLRVFVEDTNQKEWSRK
jgi:hypothetical protein